MATSQGCPCATTEQLKGLDLSCNHDRVNGKKHGLLHHRFFHFYKNRSHSKDDMFRNDNGEIKSRWNEKQLSQEEPKQDEAHQNGAAQGQSTEDEDQKPKEDSTDKDKSHFPHFHGLGFKPMAHCLDFRTRTVSFDLHNIGQNAKMSLLSKLLHRSKSESSMKVPPKKDKDKDKDCNNSSQSPKQSPGSAPRRRFVRVVRDGQSVGEEYVNPHVTRRFSKNHWEQNYLKKSASLDEDDPCRPLPYTVTGHTILKKHHSVDSDTLCYDANKHAKFNEEVEVLEYDIKGKILAIHSDASILHAKLHEGDIIHEEVVLSRDACDAITVEGVEVELTSPSCMLEVIKEATTPTDLSPDLSPEDDVTETTVLTEGLTTRTSDSDDDAEDLVSDSVFDETPTDSSEHVPKASRQISAEEECSVKKSKLCSDTSSQSSIVDVEEKLKEVES